MFELKRLNRDALASAQEKALRYRLLNQPMLAESICKDILAVDPEHQEALVTLVLCLGDHFGAGESASLPEARELIGKLKSEHDREYYTGIISERRAIGQLRRAGHAAEHIAHDLFVKAMEHYERAQAHSPEGNVDAVLRWNTCARILNTRPDLRPKHHEPMEHMLE